MRSPPKYVPRDVDAAEFGVRARWPPQRGAAGWCCWSAGPRSARPAALRSRPDPVNRGGRAGALRPCIRCTMVTRAQPGLEADAGVFCTLARSPWWSVRRLVRRARRRHPVSRGRSDRRSSSPVEGGARRAWPAGPVAWEVSQKRCWSGPAAAASRPATGTNRVNRPGRTSLALGYPPGTGRPGSARRHTCRSADARSH